MEGTNTLPSKYGDIIISNETLPVLGNANKGPINR